MVVITISRQYESQDEQIAPHVDQIIIHTDNSSLDLAIQTILEAIRRLPATTVSAPCMGFRHSAWGRLQNQPVRLAA
jgi:hypothetical protein